MEFPRFITHFQKVFLTSLKKEPADFSNCTIICCGLGKTAKVYYSHLEFQCMEIFLPALIFLRLESSCMHKILQKWMNEWRLVDERTTDVPSLQYIFNMWTVSSDVSIQRRLHWQPLSVHLWAYCTRPPHGRVLGLNNPDGGELPYIRYIGMCRPKGYGFCAVLFWKLV